jgi:microsomal dipeptidase-like Zn-dependent dipeptidase
MRLDPNRTSPFPPPRAARSRRRRRGVLALLAGLLAMATLLVPSTAQAGGNWWEPTNPQTPDVGVNVTGTPFTGTDANGNVRGFIDAHTHMFSNEGFGGNIVCGETYSVHGVATALQDCPAHYPDGRAALVENLTNARLGSPLDTHDPVGWPTFRFWPAYDSFTHQQMYYKWVERAWRGGQRIMVNDLVNNSGLCLINGVVNPLNKYNCDDMDTIRREAKKTYALQDFIDNQYGGPGKGWFRIVKSSDEARAVVTAGKMAVVLGVETSEPFGCKQNLGVPGCTKAQIDAGLDELQALGVRSMFLCHKFDNALCGVRYDEHTTGLIVNLGQFLTTGTWWQPQTCKAGEVPDHTVIGGVLPKELAQAFPTAVLPVYGPGPHCNPKGLSDLGEYALRGLMKRGMMVEVDHMSAKAADRALSIMEQAGYAGVLSSHSWLADAFAERVYRLGGFQTQYGHNTREFVEDANRTKALREKYGVGYGYGMDMNGFGGTPAPRDGGKQTNPVVYPFTTFDGGSVVSKQVSGERTFDVNTDGVAHYGQVPDWVEDIRIVGGKGIVDDLARGAESYLRTMKKAERHVDSVNLAQGRAATASSTEWSLLGSYTPAKAVDGNRSTRWASAWSDNQWLRVDLGSVQQVGKVSVEWEKAFATAYAIQVSTDGTTWRTVSSTTAGKGGLEVAIFAPQSARYVRVAMTKRATSYGYSVYELGAYAS